MSQLLATSTSHPRLMTAVLSGQLTFPLSPDNISTVPLYHVHRNLWDTILAEEGRPSIARLIETNAERTVYRFEILKTSRFCDGSQITSNDVIASVQRLIKKQPSGHFNAKSAIQSIEAESETVFKIALRQPSAAFLFLLSIPEMGIAPKSSIDQAGNLRDLKTTSGPYSVEGNPEPGQITLKKNPHFTRHANHSPDQITIIFKKTTDEMASSMNEGQGDFFEAYDTPGVEAFFRIRNLGQFGEKITRPSYSIFMSLKADRLPGQQRRALAKLLSDSLRNHYQEKPELERTSNELLPPGTFGSVSPWKPSFDGVTTHDLPKKIRLATANPSTPLAKAVTETLQQSKINVSVVDFSGDLADIDAYLVGQGMNSNFPEIEFNLNMVSSWATISATDEEKGLIHSIMRSNDTQFRKTKLEDLSRSILKDGRVIPILVRSYAHLYRKTRVQLPSDIGYDGDIHFWEMQVSSP